MPVKELYVMLKTFKFRITYSTLFIFDISDVVLELRDGSLDRTTVLFSPAK